MKIPRTLQMLSLVLAGTALFGSCRQSGPEPIETPSKNCVVFHDDTTALVHAGCMFSNDLTEGNRLLQWYLFTKKPDGTQADHFLVIGVHERDMGTTISFGPEKKHPKPWNFIYYRKLPADSAVINYVANSSIIDKENCSIEHGAMRAEYDAGRKHILFSFDVYTKDGNRINGFYKGNFLPDKFNLY